MKFSIYFCTIEVYHLLSKSVPFHGLTRPPFNSSRRNLVNVDDLQSRFHTKDAENLKLLFLSYCTLNFSNIFSIFFWLRNGQRNVAAIDLLKSSLYHHVNRFRIEISAQSPCPYYYYYYESICMHLVYGLSHIVMCPRGI